MTLLDHGTAPPCPAPPPPVPRAARFRLATRLRTLARRPGTLLSVALATGAVLRLVHLDAIGLNSDEAVYAAQAASLTDNPHFTALFPVVRAHPLLVQVLMSPFYVHGVPDTAGRYVTALFGVGTLVLTYAAGRALYHPWVGALGALFLAVMPYHVVVGRQIILDGPMAFFTTAALLLVAVAARRHDGRWLLAAGALLGLAALCKETAVILLGSCFAFLALTNRATRPLRHPLVGAGLALGLTLAYPLLTSLAGGGRGGVSYLLWQLARAPNHTPGFYVTSVGAAIGPLTLALALAGLLAFRHHLGWQEVLLLSWSAVPFTYFEIWPTKGFTYLTPLAPVVALLAAAAAVRFAWTPGRRRLAALLVAGICVVGMVVPAVLGIVRPTTSGLAGTGGTPGGREVGDWVARHTPVGAQLVTIGPSMANLVQFYGGRRAAGLSVSPDPLHRNPSYSPIRNADLALRNGTYQYIVWDTYSAQRSPHFSARAMELVQRFHGVPVEVQRDPVTGRRLVVVYQVAP